MNQEYTPEARGQALKALRSSIGKCEKAYATLKEGSPQRTYVARQMAAYSVSAALIEQEGGEAAPPRFTREELENAGRTIAQLIEKCETLPEKFAKGSPQNTLAVRRLAAFKMAAGCIAQELEGAGGKKAP